MSYEPKESGPQPVPATKETDLESQRTPEQQSDEEQEVSAIKGLGWLDRLLALWILLAMIIGILLGNFVDSVGPALHRGEFVGVSVPIGEYHIHSPKHPMTIQRKLTTISAVGLLVMMYPILCKVKYESLHQVFATKELWIQIGFSIILNWLIAPFLMARVLTCVLLATINAD
jgi:ACR3 family arsenite transporter